MLWYMQTQDYNNSRFGLEIQGLDADTFSIQSFASPDYGLSSCYEYIISATGVVELEKEQLLGKKAKLILDWQNDPLTIHGIVAGFEQKQPDQRHYQFAYNIVLKAPLYGLSLVSHNRIYTDKTVIDVVRDIIKTADLIGFQYQIKTQRTYPQIKFLMQLNETDFDFLERMLSAYGLFYLTIDKDGYPLLLITDDMQQLPKFPDSNINYHEGRGYNRTEDSIYEIDFQRNYVTNSVKLKNYDYQKPTDPLEAKPKNTKKATSGGGEDYTYGQNYQDQTAGELLATVRQQALDWHRMIYLCTTDCVGLQPGQLFTLENNPDGYNDQYRIVAAKISADQSASQHGGTLSEQSESEGQATYEAQLILIKADVIYKADPQTPAVFHHVLPATIYSTGGECATLDEHGCYLVKFPFDKNNTSCRIRSIQPYDGPTQKDPTGLHFPLRENTLVAVGFLDGDLSQPIIIGAMNDESKPSPVTNTNKTQHIIQTTAEHKLMFEDQAGKQGITLSNKDDANKLNLDATENKNSINLTSKGKIQTYANKDMHVKNAKNNITKAAKDLTIQVDGKKNLLTKNKAITHQAGQDVLIKAKDKITTNTVNKTTLKAQEDVLLQAEKNMQFHSNKSINFESTGNTTISGTQITFSGGNEGGIQLGGPGFGIEVKDGNVTLNGAQINFNCGAINVPTSPAPATPVPISPPQQVPGLTAPKAQQKKQEDDKKSTDDGKQDSSQGDKNQDQGDNNNSDQNDTQPDDQDADTAQKNLYPRAELKIENWVSELPPVSLKPYPYVFTASNSLSVSVKVENKNSVNPVTFDKEGFKIEAKNEAIKVFSKFILKRPSFRGKELSGLTIYNDYGEYNIAVKAVLISENEQQYIGEIKKEIFIDDGNWQVGGEIKMDLIATLTKDPEEKSMWKSLEYDLQYSLDDVKRALASLGKDLELIFVNPPTAKEVEGVLMVTLVGALMVAGAPAGV